MFGRDVIVLLVYKVDPETKDTCQFDLLNQINFYENVDRYRPTMFLVLIVFLERLQDGRSKKPVLLSWEGVTVFLRLNRDVLS